MRAVSVSCILCNSGNTYVHEKLDTKALASIYRARSGVEVNRLFTTPAVDLCICNDCGLKFYNPVSAGDGLFYDELQKYPGYYMEEKTEFIEAAKWITPKDAVLEVGCGSGNFTRFIQSKSYTGLEFSDKAIAQAQANNVNVIKEDLAAHAMRNPQSYDVVCYFQVLEHVVHPGQFIKQSLDCLKPGGKLLIAVPSEDSFIKDAVNFYLNMPPHHASRWTDRTLNEISRLFNLETLAVFHEPLNRNHYRFYSKTKIYQNLRRMFGLKRSSLDLSFSGRLAYALASLLAIPHSATVDKKSVTGQSVLSIYRKKE